MSVTKKPYRDFDRPEGAYVTPETTGLPPYDVTLYRLERVNGDCSVSELLVTEAEALSIVERLAKLGVKERADSALATLEKENRILRDGLAIVGPLATRPDPA